MDPVLNAVDGVIGVFFLQIGQAVPFFKKDLSLAHHQDGGAGTISGKFSRKIRVQQFSRIFLRMPGAAKCQARGQHKDQGFHMELDFTVISKQERGIAPIQVKFTSRMRTCLAGLPHRAYFPDLKRNTSLIT
jgi:hypothetical protein